MMNVKNNLINPWTLTGLIDADGSFGVVVIEDVSRSSGFSVTVFLEIGLNSKDKELLVRIKNTFPPPHPGRLSSLPDGAGVRAPRTIPEAIQPPGWCGGGHASDTKTCDKPRI